MNNEFTVFDIFDNDSRYVIELIPMMFYSLGKPTYYISRFIMGNKNSDHKNQLMFRVIEWANTHDYIILVDIDKYNNEMNFDQQISFYKRFGFKESNSKEYNMIYKKEELSYGINK